MSRKVRWLLPDCVPVDFRVFAGPVLLLRTQGTEDHVCAGVGLVIFLPFLFAVGVRANAATITLAVLGALLWVGSGVLIEGMSG